MMLLCLSTETDSDNRTAGMRFEDGEWEVEETDLQDRFDFEWHPLVVESLDAKVKDAWKSVGSESYIVWNRNEPLH